MSHSIPVAHAGAAEHATRARIAPAVDVYESPAGITIHADMPGCTPENLSIDVEGDTLTIEGTATFAAPAGSVERLGENEPLLFVRSFQLRDDLDRAGISATLKDGVLTVSLPRAAEKRGRKIEVKLA